MITLKKLFKKIGYLSFFLNIYFSYAQIDPAVIKNDPALDAIVDEAAEVEKLADGFAFTEGPVWHKDGFLLFTDIPKNAIMKWTPDGKVSKFREPSNNANGLIYRNGNLVMCEHSGRRLSQLLPGGAYSIIVDNFQGKKFNSPNDVAIKSDGSYYFTDPPYGLPEGEDDSAKQISYSGVFRFHKNKLELLDSTLERPNGIAFSPDEKFLYVTSADKWIRYEVEKDGSIKNAKVFYDASSMDEPGGPDGMKVDVKGNLFCSGPGGILIFSPKGKHLGTIKFPEIPSNCAFGDPDMKTLYVTARTGLYRVKLKTKGIK